MTFKAKSISFFFVVVVGFFFLKGLRGSFPCRGENKTSNNKPCLYTGDPCEGCAEFGPPDKRYGPAIIETGLSLPSKVEREGGCPPPPPPPRS